MPEVTYWAIIEGFFSNYFYEKSALLTLNKKQVPFISLAHIHSFSFWNVLLVDAVWKATHHYYRTTPTGARTRLSEQGGEIIDEKHVYNHPCCF